MRTKELIKLPLGRTFELTDGLYTFLLKKEMTDIGIMYSFKEKGSLPFRDSFSVFEEQVKDEEDERISYPRLIYCASISCFTFHGDFYMPTFSRTWNIVTDMDLKKYMEKQFNN